MDASAAVAVPDAHVCAATPASDSGEWLPAVTALLDRPLSAWWCRFGWLAASGLFVALVFVFAGPSTTDANESTYSAWAIAHGDVACAYPPVGQPQGAVPPGPPIPPVYPLLSAGIAAITDIGHHVPYPSSAALGPGCRNGFDAEHKWAVESGAQKPTVWIGCLGWFALMAGVIAWLRACGRGRRGWEPFTLVVVAGLLPVWMAVQSVFHPQDLLALGFALWAVASARRGRWILAGILCSIAILSQQFALLVALPLVVVAPARKRLSFVAAGLVTGTIVVLPMAVMTSGHVVRAIALGSGDSPGVGGTVLWELHSTGAGTVAVLLFRIAPLAVSLAVSLWAARRLGERSLDPVPLLSLIAVSLTLRLVFEVSLWTYYFMALAVCLVLLEVTQGAIRRSVAAWFAVLTLVICRISIYPFGLTKWGLYLQNDLLSILIGGAALLAVMLHFFRGDDRRTLWPWLIVAFVDLFNLLPLRNGFMSGQVVWFSQLVLVVPGMLLAAQPLRNAIRNGARSSERLSTASMGWHGS